MVRRSQSPARNLLRLFKYILSRAHILVRVDGDSMHPTFMNSELLAVKKTKSSDRVNIGDVVVFEHYYGESKNLIIKRVAEINDQGMSWVVGDGVYSSDSREYGWISRERIIGKEPIRVCSE